jgi:4-nitrophenyl phosphatase
MYKTTFDKLGIQVKEVRPFHSLWTRANGQEEIFGSAYASAVYISKVLKMPKEKKVYVIGQAGLEEELDNLGIARCGGTVCPLYPRGV